MVAILKQGSLLIASIPPTTTDQDFRDLLDDLAEKVTLHRSDGVVLDVSAVDVLDSYATNMLQTMASVVRLRGARTAIVGIQPAVALAMVELGLGLEGVHTALDLEDGLRLLQDGGAQHGT